MVTCEIEEIMIGNIDNGRFGGCRFIVNTEILLLGKRIGHVECQLARKPIFPVRRDLSHGNSSVIMRENIPHSLREVRGTAMRTISVMPNLEHIFIIVYF